MSEPDSLYLRVRLSKAAYERYLSSPALDARDFSDWMGWLGNAKMYGDRITVDDIARIGKSVSKRSVAEEIESWTATPFARSDYDEATETWRFGALEFTNNYGLYLEFLPPLRGADRFKDGPGVDFILAYNYIWRPTNYTVLLELRDSASIIAGSPGQGVAFPSGYAEEASAFLAQLAPNASYD